MSGRDYHKEGGEVFSVIRWDCVQAGLGPREGVWPVSYFINRLPGAQALTIKWRSDCGRWACAT